MDADTGPLRFIPPMECTPVAELPDDGAKWLYEVKLDGYRCCAVARGGGKAALYSRYGNLWTDRFDEIRNALGALKRPMILDGEIVALDRNGLPSFQQLQNNRGPIVFYAFDLLHLGGRDLRREAVEERKKLLQKIPLAEPLRFSSVLDAPLPTLVQQMKTLGLEGLVAKRIGSHYESGERSRSWLKRRFNQVDEFVIGGYLPEGSTFSRLLIGNWEDDRLIFVKKLKNGFSAYTKEEVMNTIRRLRTKHCPFTNLAQPKGRSAVDEEVMKEAVWVKPERSVEVEFVERTAGGRLRHASFRKLV